MNPRFLPFIWAMTALIAPQTWGQTIIPTPRPGTVLWTKTVTNMQSGAALYLTADERSVVTATSSGPNFTPLSINLSTQTFGTLGDPERLAGKLVTLSDGGVVKQPVLQSGDGSTVTDRFGVGGWTLKTNGRLGPYLDRMLAPCAATDPSRWHCGTD